jgi:hypothetical protein
VECDLAALGSTANSAREVQGCRRGRPAGQDEALQRFELPFEGIDVRFELFDVRIFRLRNRSLFAPLGVRRGQVPTEVEQRRLNVPDDLAQIVVGRFSCASTQAGVEFVDRANRFDPR